MSRIWPNLMTRPCRRGGEKRPLEKYENVRWNRRLSSIPMDENRLFLNREYISESTAETFIELLCRKR